MERKNELLIRAYFVMILFVMFAVLIGYRVFKISVVEGEKWRDKGGVYVKWMPIEADRGNIYADDNNMLVTSLPFFDIRMDLLASSEDVFNEGVDSLAILLSRHVDATKAPIEWKEELVTTRNLGLQKKKAGARYHFIANKIGYDELLRLRQFPIFRKGKYGGGLITEKKTVREKPYKGLAGRTLGRIRPNAPNYGLESSFDKFLKGATDRKLMKRIPGNIWIPVYDPSERETKKGDDLMTTINVDIQDIAQEELLDALYDNDAKGGAAIVMEVATGQIKAIANFERLAKGGYAEAYNHAIGTLSEPGSTFKTATVLAMLDDGHVTLETQVDLNRGKKKFYKETMYDSHPHNEREVSIGHAFATSSNVGIATLAYESYKGKEGWKAFREKIADMTLDQKLGIELEGERQPYFKDPLKPDWYGTTVPWMSHGYELQMTPLQTLQFYNAIANGGVAMRPYLVKEIVRGEETFKKFRPKVVNPSIANPTAIASMQTLLEQVVVEGTAKSIRSEVVSFAGKTGTARVNYADRGAAKKYNASFAGYFPAEQPKYSIMVMVYEPQKRYSGAAVAGPVFKNIAEKIFTIKHREFDDGLERDIVESEIPSAHSGYASDFQKVFSHTGVKYDKRTKAAWAELNPSDDRMNIEKMKIKKHQVPDVSGMGMRDAVYILENLGLQVSAEGIGKVKRQSLRPGAQINGQQISIYLN